jgi:hypothetical protein
MKTQVTKITRMIRKYVQANFPSPSLEMTPLMLLACADMIDRLTRERDEGIIKIGQLERKIREHDST